MSNFLIENKYYSISEIQDCISGSYTFVLSQQIKERVSSSHNTLIKNIELEKTIYGVNTGFGKLSNVKIKVDEMKSLQKNLLMSHAAGVGLDSPESIVKIMMFLKVLSLARGYSGVRLELIEKILELLNNNCYPIVPCQGSVGASGDLAQLSHMSLPIIGLGELQYKTEKISAQNLLKKIKIKPLELTYKEGLALINGTQFSTAYGVQNLDRLLNLLVVADIAGAISTEGLMGTNQAFDDKVNSIKLHPGQKQSASNLYNLLENSQILMSHIDCDRVQDMYSIRCMPQVHGACRDTVFSAKTMVENEINSVSDNPLVFSDGEVISAGNFHAESVAQAMDIAALAAVELGNISERRIFTLTKGDFGLPPFLVSKPGINSGVMMWQVTAAALASENKGLSHPASADNIPTGSDQEDHVSMAPWAGRKLCKIIDNLENILAIEILCGFLAINFRKKMKPGKGVSLVYDKLKNHIKAMEHDRIIKKEIDFIRELIKSKEFINTLKTKIKIQ